MKITKHQLAQMLDHTMLKIDATYGEIHRVCLEAEKYRLSAVAVHPANVALAAKMLKGTGVKVCAALGFHMGTYPPEIKEFECRDAVAKGADELAHLKEVNMILLRKRPKVW